MPTKESTPTAQSEKFQQINTNRYYSELARLSTWLFIGVLALMTFLLTVGLQHPQKPFSEFVYASLIVLPLGLLFYVLGQMIQMRQDGVSKKSSMDAWLKAVRMLQQLLFILSLVAVTGFGIVAAHIFFAPPAASSQVQQGQ